MLVWGRCVVLMSGEQLHVVESVEASPVENPRKIFGILPANPGFDKAAE